MLDNTERMKKLMKSRLKLIEMMQNGRSIKDTIKAAKALGVVASRATWDQVMTVWEMEAQPKTAGIGEFFKFRKQIYDMFDDGMDITDIYIECERLVHEKAIIITSESIKKILQVMALEFYY